MTVAVPTEEYRLRLHGLSPRVRCVIWDPYTDNHDSEDSVLEDVDVVLLPDTIDAAVVRRLSGAPKLKLVQLQSAGYDHVVGNLADSVSVCNGTGVHSDETAEWAVGLVLASLRGLPRYHDQQKARLWAVDPGLDFLAGSRVMVVGAGSIGREIAKRLSTFKVDLTRVARSARSAAHGEVLSFEQGMKVL